MAAKSTKKAKTPGPDGKKKSSIMEKRAQSEGSRATRSKTPGVKTPANANKSATKKTPKKTPKKVEVEEKKKLTFDDEEAIATPAAKKGMKPKTPKSSRKAEVSKPTPKGGATPKGKKATSEEAKQKTPKSAKKKDAVKLLPYGLDDEEYDEDEDDNFVDMDGSDSDEGSDFSDDESDADDDEEVVFNTPEKVKKISEPVTSSLSPSKTKKTPKSAMKAPQTDNKPKKTPKSALKSKVLGTAKSDKKVSLAVTVPDETEEKQHKKAATTPHPSLTKLKRRAPSVDDDKENQKNSKGSSLQEEQLNKQLSFGDDNSEEDMETEVKGQGVKRKHKATKSVKPDGPPEKKGKQDGYLYHCGNLPNRVDKSIVKLFFSEAGVNVISIVVRNEKLTKMERTEGKDKKKGKLIKKKTKIDHCYGILKVATEEEGKKLEELNGIEFTAPQGRWRSHQLTIYPMLQRPVKEVKEDEPCVFVKLGYKIDDQQLRDFLTEHKVEPRKTFIVRRGIRQVSKGYGFAWFKSPEEVERAIKLSGKDLQGFKVDISQAKPKKNAKQHPYKIGSERS